MVYFCMRSNIYKSIFSQYNRKKKIYRKIELGS
jgi:hypothetical protein